MQVTVNMVLAQVFPPVRVVVAGADRRSIDDQLADDTVSYGTVVLADFDAGLRARAPDGGEDVDAVEDPAPVVFPGQHRQGRDSLDHPVVLNQIRGDPVECLPDVFSGHGSPRIGQHPHATHHSEMRVVELEQSGDDGGDHRGVRRLMR